jgi:hypothetical protein
MYGCGAIVQIRKLRPAAAQSHRLPDRGQMIAHDGALRTETIERLLEMAEQRFRRE